jgi:hypothetical protein
MNAFGVNLMFCLGSPWNDWRYSEPTLWHLHQDILLTSFPATSDPTFTHNVLVGLSFLQGVTASTNHYLSQNDQRGILLERIRLVKKQNV